MGDKAAISQPDSGHGQQIIQAIENAVKGVKAREFSAIVTNRLPRTTSSGGLFPGHTEFLAYLDGGTTPSNDAGQCCYGLFR